MQGRTDNSFNMSDELDMSKPDMGEPIQIEANVGDAVFLPGMLMPRRDSPNYSAHIRYMVIYESLLLYCTDSFHFASQLYFRVSARRQTLAVDISKEGIWTHFDPSIAPASLRKKNIVHTEGTFSL